MKEQLFISIIVQFSREMSESGCPKSKTFQFFFFALSLWVRIKISSYRAPVVLIISSNNRQSILVKCRKYNMGGISNAKGRVFFDLCIWNYLNISTMYASYTLLLVQCFCTQKRNTLTIHMELGCLQFE